MYDTSESQAVVLRACRARARQLRRDRDTTATWTEAERDRAALLTILDVREDRILDLVAALEDSLARTVTMSLHLDQVKTALLVQVEHNDALSTHLDAGPRMGIVVTCVCGGWTGIITPPAPPVPIHCPSCRPVNSHRG